MSAKKFDSSCTSPMVMLKDGFNPSGKPKYKMLGLAQPADFNDPDRIIVPCGNCINCRLRYSRQWADRLMFEAQMHENAWFVTLTYNDFWLPTSYYTDENTGELIPSYSLWKRDWQLFMKRLRKAVSTKYHPQELSFYMCGEYGPKTYRPHYHAIIFGLKLDDEDLYNERRGKSGFSLWQSHTIEKAWSKEMFGRKWPIGHVMVAPVNWQTCAYVSRYVTKKLKGEKSVLYSDFGLQAPFSLMSRKKGIGRSYLESHWYDFVNNKPVYIPTDKGSKFLAYPDYFYKILDLNSPELCATMKEKKRDMARQFQYSNLRSVKTDLDYFEYNELRAVNADSRLKKLIREEV